MHTISDAEYLSGDTSDVRQSNNSLRERVTELEKRIHYLENLIGSKYTPPPPKEPERAFTFDKFLSSLGAI